LASDKAEGFKSMAECSEQLRERPRRHPAEKPDHRRCRLLRPRRERPSQRRTAEQGCELAPFHCSVPPVLPTKENSTQGTAALRDFEPIDVRYGSMLLKKSSMISPSPSDGAF
jgi:hypothetical protein